MAEQHIHRLIRGFFPYEIDIENISSKLVPNIIDDICRHNLGRTKTLVLITHDVWRYGGSYELQAFLGNLPVPVFVFHLGYTNRRVVHNVFEIAWPFWYFMIDRSASRHCPKSKGLPYGYGCLNNSMDVPRLLLGYHLLQADCLGRMIFSQNDSSLCYVSEELQFLRDTLPDFERYQKLLPITTAERMPRPEPHHAGFQEWRSTEHDAYDLCYCNIVSESAVVNMYMYHVAVETPVVTEKSFKPFLTAQIPIYLAAHGHLPYLASLGFETMQDFMPPGYDTFGLYEKVRSITETVTKGTDYAESFYHDHLRELVHNLEIVYSDYLWQKILSETQATVCEYAEIR